MSVCKEYFILECFIAYTCYLTSPTVYMESTVSFRCEQVGNLSKRRGDDFLLKLQVGSCLTMKK